MKRVVGYQRCIDHASRSISHIGLRLYICTTSVDYNARTYPPNSTSAANMQCNMGIMKETVNGDLTQGGRAARKQTQRQATKYRAQRRERRTTMKGYQVTKKPSQNPSLSQTSNPGTPTPTPSRREENAALLRPLRVATRAMGVVRSIRAIALVAHPHTLSHRSSAAAEGNEV
jgi:hypothetical protein